MDLLKHEHGKAFANEQNGEQKKVIANMTLCWIIVMPVLSVQFHTLCLSSEQCRSSVSFNLIYLAMII